MVSMTFSETQGKLEQSVLSTLIVYPGLLKSNEPNIELFKNPLHRDIYLAIKNSLVNDTVDPIKVFEEIGENNIDYFLKLQDSCITNERYESDISRLEELNRVYKSNELTEKLNKNEIDFEEYVSSINKINNETYSYSNEQKGFDVNDIYNLITTDSKKIEFSKYKKLSSIGMIEQTLNIISARPSIGKSAFALNLLDDLSKQRKYKCIYLNMEMTEKEIFERLIGINTKIKISDFPGIKDNSKNKALMLNSLEDIKGRNITIINRSLSIDDIKKLITVNKRLNRDKHIILFVDYLGYIRSKNKSNDRERMGQIVRELQTITKDYCCTIFLLAQINREGTDNPTLQNLKDTGELEQSGHCIMLLDDIDKNNENVLTDIHRMKVNIAKNRSGKRGGNIYFDYYRATQIFSEVIKNG
ncbi:MAG: DnaB-like helicase C-terminal domain-containing protein [Bacilli bacterium]